MIIDELIEFNKKFVENKEYEKYQTTKFPYKKIAIVSCMDTRLVQLLPEALGIKNGDVKMIKNAGGMILSPFDGTVRSILISIYELGVEEIMIIGHTDCGVAHVFPEVLEEQMMNRGISKESIDMVKYCEVDFEKWLTGFNCVEESVIKSVEILRKHPLIPKDVRISGYIMDTNTGKLEFVL